MTDNDKDPSVDGPTVMGPGTGHLAGADSAPPTGDEPTVEDTATTDSAESSAEPSAENTADENTVVGTWQAWPPVDGGPTVSIPRPADETTVSVPRPDDEPTTAVGTDEVTTTGPTVAGWPVGEPEPPPPAELIWRTDPPPSRTPGRTPAYYIALGAAVVLVVGLVAAAAIATAARPTTSVAGTAVPTQGVPQITTTTTAAPPPAPTTAPQPGPLAAVASHPLSTWQGRMADTTCELPRFDLPDDRQAAFFAAAKTCADNAWRGVLAEAGLTGGVKLVTVTQAVQTPSCGEITPTSPSTQCDGTVYMTPAHLRDTERNDRYPGKYLGVFLREYARALQFTSGLSQLVGEVDSGSAEDLDERLAQQATCLAGVVSGAMAGRGAVDDNITGEIATRLTTVDAPPDAEAWLDKGFQARQPSACNTWT